MERLFFDESGARVSRSLHLQNFARASRATKATPVPGYFVEYRISKTLRYSLLSVDIVSPRPEKTLLTSQAEFRRHVENRFLEVFGFDKWHATKRALTVPPRWTCIRLAHDSNSESLIKHIEGVVSQFNESRPSSSQCRLSAMDQTRLPNCLHLDFAPPLISVQGDFLDIAVSSLLGLDREAADNGELQIVIVDSKCGEAVLRGADVFAPGIKAASTSLESGSIVRILIDLDSMVLVGSKDVTAAELLAANGRFLFVGLGRAVQPRWEMVKQGRSGVAVKMLFRPTGDSPGLNDLLPGQVYLQNLPSATVGFVLAPLPGELVLDMCASPGGKTCHLADLMRETGVLVACDRTVAKCVPVKQVCDQFASKKGLDRSIARVCQSDSAKLMLSVASREERDRSRGIIETKLNGNGKGLSIQGDISDMDLSESEGSVRREALETFLNSLAVDQSTGIMLLPPGRLPKGCFDRVLLDGPCSALGLRPRFSHVETTPRALDDMAVVQRRMLFNALNSVKVGGVIVYSTCTINHGENEQVVEWFLRTYGKFVELLPAEPRVGGPGLESILGPERAAMVQRFDPADVDVDTTGFFIAKFIKTTKLPIDLAFEDS